MCIPRLLVLALLISGCVAPVVAQSASDNEPGSFYSQPPGPLFPDAMASLRLVPSQPPIEIDVNRLYLSRAKPDGILAGALDWTVKPTQDRARIVVRSQNDATCYSIRSYRVTRDDPESDSTRVAGYSTCQPASRFQVKGADDRQEIVPR